MIDRQTNFLFAYVLLLVFVMTTQTQVQLSILLGLALSTLIVSLVFLVGFLSLEAIVPAVLVGSIAYGIGGIESVTVLGAFFISASVLTLINDQRVRVDKLNESRRGGRQVWSNAFWFVSYLIGSFVFDSPALMIASVSAIASSSADTWGTEAGLLPKNSKTYSISRFQEVKPGTDGGVSLFGTLASLVGSALIGGLYSFSFSDQDIHIFLIVTISGFMGSLVDSILGDRFQTVSGDLTETSTQDKRFKVTNNMVNWLSTGLGGIIGIILYYSIFR
jgi:uncharacterized protein (TIGR00297 family)